MKNRIIKKRILLLITATAGGGAENLVLNHLKFYNKDRFNVYVIAFKSGNLHNKFKEVGKDNYICINLRKSSRFSIKTTLKLVTFIKQKRIDIIHTHLIEADLYGFIMKIFFPNLLLFSTRHGENKFRKSFFWGIANYIISLIDYRIICVSQSLMKFINHYEHIPKKKLILIYNGIDTDYYKNENSNNFRNNLTYINKTEDFIIGIVGRLHPLKGHHYLFHAIYLLKEEGYNNLKLLVIGQGKQYKNLVNLRAKLNIFTEIKFLGYKQNLKSYYNIFDLLCIASNYEGLSLVILEAMACKSLVLCSNIPNNLEAIEDNKNGITFEKGNSLDLSVKIKKIINNEYDVERLKNNARNNVETKFDYTKNLKELEKIYLNSR